MTGSPTAANRPVPSQKMRQRGAPVATTDAADTSRRLTTTRAAYAEIVSALADARPDPATERFDAEVDAAVDAGRLDVHLARTLRWWQRESVRGVRDHLVDVVPSVLATLDESAARVEPSPEVGLRADNINGDNANTARGWSNTRTVDPQMHQRRRVLVASLVAAANTTTVRVEGEEGRR
jgi:hypothetical protein